MMSVSWAQAEDITVARLDSPYYDKQILRLIHDLRTNHTLNFQPLEAVTHSITSFGAYAQYELVTFLEKAKGRVPFVTVTELEEPFIRLDRLRYISFDVHAALHKSQCRPLDILLS